MSNCSISNENNQKVQDYKKTISEALTVLNKKNLSLIIHGVSFPSVAESNVGIGSPNSQGAKNLINFVGGIFNSIQLGPAGKTKAVDSSPYTGTIFSNNPLFIDLEELTTSKWAKILSKTTFEDIVANNPNKGKSKAAYSYIFNKNQEALREAFENFKTADLPEIKAQFEKFKADSNSWLEKDAVYEAISTKYGNDYWPLWTDNIDKNLYNPQSEDEAKSCAQRLKEIKAEYGEVIEFYSFCQFVAFVQKEAIKEYAAAKNIKMIADRQVAFSDRDYWANQALFLKGWNLGCPPDYFSKDGQAWGFPVMDPEKLFNADGSLGEGGKLLKALFTKMFVENPGGVRIDHVVGLIDPWVYKNGTKPKPEEGAGRLYSSPEHPELSKFAVATCDDLNYELEPDKEYRVKKLTSEQVQKYGALMEKIVIAAAQEQGLTKDAIICEDLGTLTYPVESVMKQLGLNGMRLTQFVVPEKPAHPYRCCNIESNQWAMVGTHDNEPIAMWADKTINTHEGYLHALNLAADLLPENQKAQSEDFVQKLTTDAKFLAKTKLVELFVCDAQNIQIFFTDFFGIKDVYNKPGTSGDANWSLRLPDNFEEFYCDQIKNKKAMNLPEILKLAIIAKGEKFAAKNAELLEKLEVLEQQCL